MTDETYKKAVILKSDIENLSKVIEESDKKKHWIKVITPDTEIREMYYSLRFQNELTEWLKNKKEEYLKEFESLNCEFLFLIVSLIIIV